MYFKNSDPKKFILRKAGQVRRNASAGHTTKFLGRTWYEIRIRETKGPYGGMIQKGDTHERHPCALKFEEWALEETCRQENGARKSAWNLARKIFELKADDKLRFYSPEKNKGAGASLQKTKERMFVVDLGASMHMLTKKDLSSDELDTLCTSPNEELGTLAENNPLTGYEPNFFDNYHFSETTEIFIQESSSDTRPSYLQISDDTIGRILSSPLSTQERN